METIKQISTQQLSSWLKDGKEVTILDIRPLVERNEWHIPKSIHIDAYDKLKAGNTQALNDLQINNMLPVYPPHQAHISNMISCV